MGAVKKNEEIVDFLYDRILGRIALYDINHPNKNEVIVYANEIIDVSIAAINIISMSAITVMIDLRFIKKLPFYWI